MNEEHCSSFPNRICNLLCVWSFLYLSIYIQFKFSEGFSKCFYFLIFLFSFLNPENVETLLSYGHSDLIATIQRFNFAVIETYLLLFKFPVGYCSVLSFGFIVFDVFSEYNLFYSLILNVYYLRTTELEASKVIFLYCFLWFIMKI